MDQNSALSEKEILEDVLASQKQMTSLYNTYANECASPTVRDTFMGILNDEHMMQADVFSEMQKRSWYQTTPASQEKISQAKKEYSKQNS